MGGGLTRRGFSIAAYWVKPKASRGRSVRFLSLRFSSAHSHDAVVHPPELGGFDTRRDEEFGVFMMLVITANSALNR